MGYYVKKPVVIEAVQWTGDNHQEVAKFIGIPYPLNDGNPVIQTLEGDMTASKDDWIIRGVKGELYPCKPDIFEASYQEY